MTWRVRVWCRCCDEDAYGCFGGGSEILEDRFETKVAAEEHGWRFCQGPPWSFEAFEEEEEEQAS
jgi:hypothetical protein